MKRGTIDHPKTCALAKALGIRRYAAVGLLESLWHFTAQYAPRGDVGRWTDADIAHALDWEGDPETLIRALVLAGYVNSNRKHRLVIHDWDDHMNNGTRAYLRHRGVSAVVSGVAEPRLSPCSAHAEPRLSPGSAGRGRGSSPDPSSSSPSSPDPNTEVPAKDLHAACRARFARWYAAYPKHEDRQDAWLEFQKLEPDDALLERMLAALTWQRLLPDWRKENGQYIPQPRKYLKHRRWEDEPPSLLLYGTSSKTAGNRAAITAGLEMGHGRR